MGDTQRIIGRHPPIQLEPIFAVAADNNFRRQAGVGVPTRQIRDGGATELEGHSRHTTILRSHINEEIFDVDIFKSDGT